YGDRFYYNSVSLSGQLSNSTTAQAAAFANGDPIITATGTNVDVRNNIFSVTGSNAATGGNFWAYTTQATTLAGSTINNNVLYCAGTGTGLTNNTGRFNAISYGTLADWQAATSLNANSVSAAPVFLGADLHLDPANPSNGYNLSYQGTVVSVTTDIDGDPRTPSQTLGADQITPTICLAPNGTVAFTYDCGNSQFFLNVTVATLNGASAVDVFSDFAGNPGGVTNQPLGSYLLGPFPSLTNVVVTLRRNGDPTCNNVLGTFTYNCADFGQNALSFDGVDDRVNVAASSSLSITGTAFTVEAWVYPTAFSTAGEHGNSIVNKEGTGSAGFMLRCGNNGQIGFSVGVGTFPVVVAPVGTLILNQWQHVAGVYDGANMRIYKDGVQVASLAQTAAMIPSAAINMAIGNWINGNDRPFAGKIDEVRIWSAARTVPQLQTNMNRVLCGNEAGLRAYYQFNQGAAGGNNAGVTNLPDLTVNANNGTAQNMALIGSTSNWVVGRTGLAGCLNCDPPSGSAVTVQDCANNQFYISVTVSNLNGGPGVNVVSDYAGNPGAQFNVGTGTYQLGPFPSATNVLVTLQHTGNAACNLSLGTLTYNCADFGQNALSFDGVNDGVICPGASLDITGTQITLEAWIYPTVFKTNSFDGNIINKEGGFAGYQIRCGSTGILEFVLGTGAGYVTVSSPSGTLVLNQWQHVAGTYNGTTAILYKNGVQVASVANTASV
ncbi:MAG TPA: LamG domain-containing protein, partial [Flavobacteriales bacterium]|nr:LamG domain-containing protein [Flavobacteriales bacterium]